MCMEQIQMVDLRGQYARIKGEVDAGIREVMDSAAFVKGGKVAEFQHELEQYLGVKYVIPTGNGTDALQIALMALGLQPGDEVIVPTFTFVAAAEVAALLGLTPVLVDVDERTFNVPVEAVRRAITPRTKAIVPVHLFGQNADMEALLSLAAEHGLRVVEDACQSIGAWYTFSDGRRVRSGCMGDVGCTSFFPSKNLGCYGDGGAIFTDNEEYYRLMCSLAVHGKGSFKYDNVRLGYNSRLDTLQAAILLPKLHAFEKYERKDRNAAAKRYTDALGKTFKTPVVPEGYESSWAQYTLILDSGEERESIQAKLKEAGIPTMVYYPVPMHRQTAFKDCCADAETLGVSEYLCERVMSIPMHPYLDERTQDTIVNALLSCRTKE